MKVLFTLVLLAGFGFWMAKEIQHEQELQTQLDEARQELADVQKQIQTAGSRQNGSKSWMWENKEPNPLNMPAAPVHSY
jgi:uncharacterized iron-regulated membrane protein